MLSGSLTLYAASTDQREINRDAPTWQTSDLFLELREPQSAGACTSCDFFDSCRGGCMAAKFFTGLPMDGPAPECVKGYGEELLAARGNDPLPKSNVDHSRTGNRRKARPSIPLTVLATKPPSRAWPSVRTNQRRARSTNTTPTRQPSQHPGDLTRHGHGPTTL